MPLRDRLRAALLAVPLAACSTKAATSPADGPALAVSAAPPATASAAPPAPASAPDVAASAAAPPAPEAASAAPPPAPAASAAADAPAAIPAVKVANIGMHIGGGPNDDVTKDPIRRSVAPHFDELRRCFGLLDDLTKGGDFGVDLRIDKAGGAAKVSHPRTALKGKPFQECVVHVFEGIDFLKPRGGTTTVSYSIRFTPTKGGS
jgi:pyruvate/2-oxoglutarate dehydrogenase complex dihydrolipoamide acyltransferase (E2) component